MSTLIRGIVLSFGFDVRAVKVYGMLADAGYYAALDLDWKGYTLTVAIKPKKPKMTFVS